MRLDREQLRRFGAGAVLAWIFMTQVVSTTVFAIDGGDHSSYAMANANEPTDGGNNGPADVTYAQNLPTQTMSMASLSSTPIQFQGNAAIGRPPGQNYGIFYLVWHCQAPDHYNVYKDMGPIGTFTWHGEPAVGYYCLMNNPEVARTHAAQLRDAGIDFIFVDFTNSSGGEPESESIYQSFKVVVEEWSKIRGAPRIVPWLRLDGKGDFADRVDQLLDEHPEMRFTFRGKPLMLSLHTYFQKPDPATLARFAPKYTLREEWIYSPDPKAWDFLKKCHDPDDFRAKGGNRECGQTLGYGPDGMLEQVAVTAAYQNSYASNPDATPKFGGLTFLKQMERMDKEDAKDAPLVMITGWNEWIAVRWCLMPDGTTTNDAACPGGSTTLPNGNPVFVDQYDANYNRDLEPSTTDGHKYYDLLVGNVLGRKLQRGQVIGYIDSVTKNADGSAFVNGWACHTGFSDSINVQIYANGPSGLGEFVVGGTTNIDSGPLGDEPVGRACQDSVVGNHRFAFPVSAEQMKRIGNQTIYAHGIAIQKPEYPRKENYLLTNSGQIDFSGRAAGTGLTMASAAVTGASAPIYRFRSSGSNRHLLTASYSEGVQAGLIYEGVAFRLANAGTPGTVPVYRCNAAGNFLSLSPSCESSATNHNQIEGLLGGIYLTPATGLVKVFRVFNHATNDHLVTAAPSETEANGYETEFTLGYATQ